MLEPPGAAPHRATRLDVDPALRPGECLLRLEALVLSEAQRSDFGRTFGSAPGPLRAALLEATTDRGALPPPLSDTVILGTVAAVTTETHPRYAVGQRVACPPPASAVPLWLTSAAGWDGHSRTVPVEGHGVLGGDAPRTVIGQDVAAGVAAQLATSAHVPTVIARAVGPASRVTILGAATTAGAAAILEAVASGAEVAALVTTLQESRLAAALGAGRVVVGDTSGGAVSADLLSELDVPLADVTVVAVGDADVLETACWVTADEATILCLEPVDVRGALACASAGGFRHRLVAVSRGTAVDDRALIERFDAVLPFRELVQWRAGVGPLPTAGSPEDR